MAIRLARRMERLRASEIRELLKVTEHPEMISLAGGLPAPEFFPVQELKVVCMRLLQEPGGRALQYSTTEGHGPLREKIARRMHERQGTRVSPGEVLITSGSQQGLDLVGKVLVDEGDAVLCESPTYIGAINALRAYAPRFVEVATDDDGMMPADLERALAAHPDAKLIYVVPDFQNPSGRCWSLERRMRLMELAARFGIPVIEDCPYRDLRFEGPPLPTLKSMDAQGLVVHLGTFSKIFCPGMRLGWLSGPPGLHDKFVLVKQGADLHTSTFTQMLLDGYLELFDIEANIERTRQAYRVRRAAMIAALEADMPAGVRFTRPAGGLFVWVELPDRMNARELLAESLQRGVAFVPGGSFFPNGGHENTMRLNFSNMPEQRIAEGVGRLAAVVRDALGEERLACRAGA
jgi:DNA-binding transcriptional MocR family regulator